MISIRFVLNTMDPHSSSWAALRVQYGWKRYQTRNFAMSMFAATEHDTDVELETVKLVPQDAPTRMDKSDAEKAKMAEPDGFRDSWLTTATMTMAAPMTMTATQTEWAADEIVVLKADRDAARRERDELRRELDETTRQLDETKATLEALMAGEKAKLERRQSWEDEV